MRNTQEEEVKGMVLSRAPQGEYGRRLSVLTDRYGKITVFAQGAAKPGSHLLGLTYPANAANFVLQRGRNAWNLHGGTLIRSFAELSAELETSCMGNYFLELLSVFSREGMEETEARGLLNLCYFAMDALLEKRFRAELAEKPALELLRRIMELRVLMISGEYEERLPGVYDEGAAALWTHTLTAGYARVFQPLLPSADSVRIFTGAVQESFRRFAPYHFRSLPVLQQIL